MEIKINGLKLKDIEEKNKRGFYFGPFASAGSANWTIKMIQNFSLKVCDDTVFKNRERPCILYQIKDAQDHVLDT